MYIYNQPTGDLWETELTIAVSLYKTVKDMRANGAVIIGKGYSGHGDGRNNPVMESVRNVGPIPQGWYHIGDPLCVSPSPPGPHGPYIMQLTPEGHNALGRSGFLIHGDNATHTASEGCIILPYPVRFHIGQGSSRSLYVVNFV